MQIASFLIVLQGLSLMEATFIRRYHFDGTLYGEIHPHSSFVKYSNTRKVYWRNLTSLIEKFSLGIKGIFCTFGEGGWIAYPSQNYLFDEFDHRFGIKILVGESCIQTSELESIQPIRILNQKLIPTFITFPKAYFTGKANVYHSKTNNKRHQSMSLDVRSLLVYGNQNWTIKGQTFGTKCLSPKTFPDNETSYCAVYDLENQLGIGGNIAIRKGCEDSISINDTVELKTCYGEGLHEVFIKREPSNCKANLSLIEEIVLEQYTRIQELWKRRVHRKLLGFRNQEKVIKLPTLLVENTDQSFEHDKDPLTYLDQAKSFATNILTKLISIFKEDCPYSNSEYIQILENIFLSHLNKAWEETGEFLHNKTKVMNWFTRLNKVEELLIKCLNDSKYYGLDVVDPLLFLKIDEIENSNTLDSELEIKFTNESLQSTEKYSPQLYYFSESGSCSLENQGTTIINEILELLNNGLKYDPILTQISLIVTYLSIHCSMFDETYLTHFTPIVEEVFLHPVRIQLGETETIWSEIYPYMFNGYSIEKEGEKIVGCIAQVLTKWKGLKPDYYASLKQIMSGLFPQEIQDF